jgi:hypothetical protein
MKAASFDAIAKQLCSRRCPVNPYDEKESERFRFIKNHFLFSATGAARHKKPEKTNNYLIIDTITTA